MSSHTAQYFVNKAFVKLVKDSLDSGKTEKELAEMFFTPGSIVEPTVTNLRRILIIAKSDIRRENEDMVRGRIILNMSISDIAREVEISESEVRVIVAHFKHG